MADLLSEHDVRTALRNVLASAAGLADPTDVVDTSKLYDPPPPPGDLGLPAPPAPAMAALLTRVSRDTLGSKIAEQFAIFLLPPDLQTFTTFGPLAIVMTGRLNRMANRAVFLAICKALELDPNNVSPSKPIAHPSEAGARTFAGRLEREIARSICPQPDFRFTNSQTQDVIDAEMVADLMELVIDILSKGGCL